MGGLFTSVGGQPRTNLARLFFTGSVDSSFKPPTDSTVTSLAVQADAKIVVGGNFTNLFGQTNKFVGRLNDDGSVDTTFTNQGANGTVYSLVSQPDGKILAGGGFTSLGGQTRNGMARFGQSVAAPSNDAFASPTVLQLVNRLLSFSGSNLGATFETGESNFLGSAFGGRSVWYSYTPPEQGLLRVLLTSPTCCQDDIVYSLFVARGSSAANLTGVTTPILIDNGALVSRTRAVYADVLQGLDHRIAVDGGFWDGIFTGRNFDVSLQLFPSPTNDNFQQRYHIPGRTYATPISLLAASREPNEPAHGGGAGTLWWDWTAPFTGLVTLRGTQAGNFVPFLAAYQGTTLASLSTVSSSSQVIGQTRQLRFQTTQGQNYDLALSGAKFDTNDFPHISDELFSSGKFEFSFATLAIQVTGLSSTTNSTNGVNFSTTTRVQNFGTATSGPLRLRMIAKPGVSKTEDISGPNELADTQIELTVFNLPAPGQVAPGLSTSFTVGGTCPAPLFDPSDRNRGTGYEVFCVLEERVGTNWLLQDKLMVLQGVWPVVGGFGGPGAGIIRLDPGLESMAYDELLSVQILGPSPIDEGTKTGYVGRATFAVAPQLDFTNTTWTATRFTITNGVLQTGIVTNDTTVGITAQYSYAGILNSASRNITVRNLPSPLLTANAIRPYLPFKFSVRGVFDRQHVVERTTNLGPTAFWIPLVTNKASNVFGSFGTFTFSDPRSTNTNPRSSFYRVREFE